MRGQPVSGGVTLHWAVTSAERLREIAHAAIPDAGTLGDARRTFHRDLYLDTPDSLLRVRGATCRLRVSTSGRATLMLALPGEHGALSRFAATARAGDVPGALAGTNAVTRRLRGIVEPARMTVRIELEVERHTREIGAGWFRRPRVRVHHDIVRVRRGESVRCIQQVTLHAPAECREVDAIAAHLDATPGLRRAGSTPERAELVAKWMPHMAAEGGAGRHDAGAAFADPRRLHPEVSFLASQSRVLAMAEDPRVPLAERLRFVAIVAANLDEFFMVRVAGMKAASPETAEEAAGAWGDSEHQLGVVAAAARALQARHYTAARACLAAAADEAGVRLRRWADLTPEERAHLDIVYREEVHPALTPLAMTMSPGHPFPRLPHLSLSLAVVMQGRGGDGAHFAEVEIPGELPRLLPVSPDGTGHDVIALEEVVRGNLHRLHPDARIEQAHGFRVTRGSLLAVDEAHGSDLLQSMAEATQHRLRDAVVRIEMEEAMPELLRDLVVAQVRLEMGASVPLVADDVYLVEGLLDLGALGRIALPPRDALRYAPLHPSDPVGPDTTMLEAIAASDLLVHHPFESFAGTVVRFIDEAASDPDVTTIRMTLYRVGDDSPIADALRRAAAGGKQVYAFVELRARFDEERNVKWVRALEKSGVHVVYGLVGLKTHAKAALVVRREGSRFRSYVHVGTGNYNARTGLAYTDLSLFTCDPGIATEVGELFNSLTGSSTPLERRDRRCLIAPAGMLPGLLELIEREAAHARAGRPAAIRIKVNGLSDEEVATALERAAADGVRIDLIVRGICTLLPAPAGEPGHIRIVAGTGRFLEHSRIYHFANGGSPHYFIGSADLRPRNLRRRVELLAPVTSEAARRRLDHLLSLYIDDPSAWVLGHDGMYVQRAAGGTGAQQQLVSETTGAVVPKAKWQHALNG